MWYPDVDGDGYGAWDGEVTACEVTGLEGYVTLVGDCDDEVFGTHPGADEVCGDDIDNDCDGSIDEGDCTESESELSCDDGDAIYYLDMDGDGFGVDSAPVCGATEGYSLMGGDCDDSDHFINPYAIEFCDDGDRDCDPLTEGICWDSIEDTGGSEDPEDPEDSEDPAPTDTGVSFDPHIPSLNLVVNGTFDMGCTAGFEDVPYWGCPPTWLPVRSVTLTNDFWLGETEVTQDQFESLMGYNNSFHTDCGDCPAESLTWHESAAYANALSNWEGLETCYSCVGSGPSVACSTATEIYSCQGYRLPYEAEWEYAARGGTDFTFAGSDDVNLVAWHPYNSGGSTHPVAGLAPNAWGFYDMSGNVMEYVEEPYSSYVVGSVVDPVDDSLSSTSYVMFRGGRFYSISIIWPGCLCSGGIFLHFP